MMNRRERAGGIGAMVKSRRRLRQSKRGAARPRAAAGVPTDSSSPDLKAWIGALNAAPAGAVTEEQIRQWVEGPLRRFFPFQRFLGAYGRLSGGRIRMRNVVT